MQCHLRLLKGGFLSDISVYLFFQSVSIELVLWNDGRRYYKLACWITQLFIDQSIPLWIKVRYFIIEHVFSKELSSIWLHLYAECLICIYANRSVWVDVMKKQRRWLSYENKIMVKLWEDSHKETRAIVRISSPSRSLQIFCLQLSAGQRSSNFPPQSK